MKLIVILTLITFGAIAQKESKIDTGIIKGAHYRIVFPENWKNKLVMYAHGYEFMGSPRQSKNNDFVKRMAPFLERGYAVAASDYAIQGYSLPQGVEDTERLRNYFFKKYGKPDSTFMVGHSLGGGITVAIMENFDRNYQGALPLCTFGSRAYLQCRKEFDIYATFNGLFPDIVNPLSVIFDLQKPYQAQDVRKMMNKAMEIKKAIIAQDSILGLAFAKRFEIKFDDLPFTLFFNENILRDIAQKAGGNPFDNTNTIYSGFPDDLKVNKKAERLAATVDANAVFGKYDKSGSINKPMLMVHTLYDQLIPPTYGEVNFENMVHQKGKDQYYTVKYTGGQGHCNFTAAQIGQAFNELRAWVKTGIKAKPGYLE